MLSSIEIFAKSASGICSFGRELRKIRNVFKAGCMEWGSLKNSILQEHSIPNTFCKIII
jgi:hypothetical protein